MAAYIDPQGKEVQASRLPEGTTVAIASVCGRKGNWLVVVDGTATFYSDDEFRSRFTQLYPRLKGAEPESIQQQRRA